MSTHTVAVDSSTMGSDSEVFRCPSDNLNSLNFGGTSYGFNEVGSSAAPGDMNFDVRRQCTGKMNSDFSPLSTLDQDGPGGGWMMQRGQAKYYSAAPADTYLMMEYWGNTNVPADDVLDLKNPRKACKMTLWSTETYVTTPGNPYYFLCPYTLDSDSYAENIQGKLDMRGSSQQWGKNHVDVAGFKGAIHRGTSNILTMDGHSEAVDLKKTLGTAVRSNPQWTALLD